VDSTYSYMSVMLQCYAVLSSAAIVHFATQCMAHSDMHQCSVPICNDIQAYIPCDVLYAHRVRSHDRF
jgi:hypothetical protein